MKRRRLVLCLLMAIAMTVTMIPGVSFADDGGSGESGHDHLKWYVGEYNPNQVLMNGEAYLRFDVLDIETDEKYTGELTYQWYECIGYDEQSGMPTWQMLPRANDVPLFITKVGDYKCDIYDSENQSEVAETAFFTVGEWAIDYDGYLVLKNGKAELEVRLNKGETPETDEFTCEWEYAPFGDDQDYNTIEGAEEFSYIAEKPGYYNATVTRSYDDPDDPESEEKKYEFNTAYFSVNEGINKLELDVSAPVCGQEAVVPKAEDDAIGEYEDWENQ